MRITLILFTLIIGSFSLTAQSSFPDIDLKTLDKQTVNIKEAVSKGNLTVVSFWATWCSPCKRELDAVAEIYPDWQEEYNVEFIAVTTDNARTLAKVPGMVEAKGWDFTVLSDVNQDLMNALNFETIPQTFLIDGEGNIIYSHNGYNPGDEFELEDKIAVAAGK